MAAYRIHCALIKHGVDSLMRVDNSFTGHSTVQKPSKNLEKIIIQAKGLIGKVPTRFLGTQNTVTHSPAFIPSRIPSQINRMSVDIVHLHWINNEMISIEDIAKMAKPLIWTLHDMWSFCGAEHYSMDERWEKGYHKNNRPKHEHGFDLNRWVWKRKLKHWKKPIHIVTPSSWLANCVKQSVIMKDWPVKIIHNCLDTNFWKPWDKPLARTIFNLPEDCPIALFSSAGGITDIRKGFHLFERALNILHGQKSASNLQIVILGLPPSTHSINIKFPVHYMGYLRDEISLNLLYSAADILAIPSTIDNLPNTGVEALASGTPVVAFDTGGLPDIVQHGRTGYLAKAFESEDFARGIEWILIDKKRHKKLCQEARKYAVEKFSYDIVAKQYFKLYKDICHE